MPAATMTPIQIQRVARLKRLHHLGEVSLPGFHQQMDMVRQKAVTKKRDLFEFAVVNQLLQIPFAVEIVLKNLLTIVASTNQMVNGTGIFDTKRP